jgi:nucleoside-diphosphate-sugar epimerase
VSRRALVVGGTGQIGRAAAAALARDGWEVVALDRGRRPLLGELAELGVTHDVCDRDADGALVAAVGAGAELLVDTVAYTAEHGRQLAGLAGRVGALVVVSSASVYADAAGRTLDEATGEANFPALPVPIPERHPTVAPGDETYSTRKVALERVLLGQDDVPATVLRPGAIHGPGSRGAREWYFGKRALDRREVVVLAYRGESVFHTTSVANLAELIRLAADRPGRRVLNAGDPDPPPVAAIGRLVGAIFGHAPRTVLLPGAPPSEGVGDTPWSVPADRPLVVAMDAARDELGYAPVTTYPEAVGATCRWLVEATRGRDWREVLPDLARYAEASFDYAAEDAYLATWEPSGLES